MLRAGFRELLGFSGILSFLVLAVFRETPALSLTGGYGKVALACKQSSRGDGAGVACAHAHLLLHWHPDLEPAMAGGGIEILVITLEAWRVGSLEA